jgi:predicted SAM-dependent methyltransferase
MIETIFFEGEVYPKFQSEGRASQFAIPYALHVCKGRGYDIGCKKQEWAFPGAICIDPELDPTYHALHLPEDNQIDYIFSSHCAEHLVNWVDALDYWHSRLKVGGTLFIYLPEYSQRYWRPWSNRKHIHVLTPELIRDYLMSRGMWHKVFVSGVDLNNSFMAMAQKYK